VFLLASGIFIAACDIPILINLYRCDESMGKSCYIIFGAAVKENGEPSGTLLRRTLGALAFSQMQENTYFIATGGKGKYGKSEASVIAKLLVQNGVSPERIILDEMAIDTLESVVNCCVILKENDFAYVYVCSSPYHNWRCQILFCMSGIKTIQGKMPSDRPALGFFKWLFYYFRELVATPWDMFLLWLKVNNKRNES